MGPLLSRALARGARQAEIHHTTGTLRSVRYEASHITQKQGTASRFQLRLIANGTLGMSTAPQFSDDLIVSALAVAQQGSHHSGFLEPHDYAAITGIDALEIRKWPNDAVAKEISRIQQIFQSTVRKIEISVEREEIELANSHGLVGTYAHSLVRLVAATGGRAGGPSRVENYYWRTKPTHEEMVARIQSQIGFDMSDLPTRSLTGKYDVLITPQAAPVLFEDVFTQWLENSNDDLHFPEFLTIHDDATQHAGIRSRPLDDAGYSSKPLPVMKAGRFIAPPPNYAGLHVLEDNGRMTHAWNNMLVEPHEAGVSPLLNGVMICGMERRGGAYAIRGYLTARGEPVHRISDTIIREAAGSVLTRVAAIGNDTWTWDAVQAPSIIIENVAFDSSPFAV